MKYDTQILNKNVNDMHNNIKYIVTCVRMSDPFTLIKYQIITQLYTKHINSSCKLTYAKLKREMTILYTVCQSNETEFSNFTKMGAYHIIIIDHIQVLSQNKKSKNAFYPVDQKASI